MFTATQNDQKSRLIEIKLEKENEDKKREEIRKNKNFTQTYPQGWQRIRSLAKGNPGAVGLYSFFAEHIDGYCGAVVVDQRFLAYQLGVTTRTIRNWIKYLEEQKALVKIPVAGRVCAFALNPHEVWKGYSNSKEYSAFVTKTLVNQDGEIKKRIMSMFHADDPEKPEIEK